MKKNNYYIISTIILSVFIITFTVLAEEAVDIKAKAFLASYGWQIKDNCIEKAAVIIPSPFDLVYENYNELQKEVGLDLIPYMGHHGTRYTYEVTNYPTDVNEQVRANIILIDGNFVAGDICTVSLDGFMHSLKFN